MNEVYPLIVYAILAIIPITIAGICIYSQAIHQTKNKEPDRSDLQRRLDKELKKVEENTWQVGTPSGEPDPKLRMYDSIHEGICPVCASKDHFLNGPSGGMAINIMCNSCKQKYWLVPGVRPFGAKKI
jgi:hypothetical protein